MTGGGEGEGEGGGRVGAGEGGGGAGEGGGLGVGGEGEGGDGDGCGGGSGVAVGVGDGGGKVGLPGSGGGGGGGDGGGSTGVGRIGTSGGVGVYGAEDSAGSDVNSGTERTSGNGNERISGMEAIGAGSGRGIIIDPGMEPISPMEPTEPTEPMDPIEAITGISIILREGAFRGATAGASAWSARKYAVLVQFGVSSSSESMASHREKKVHSAQGTHTSSSSSMQPWLCITWKAAQPSSRLHSSAHASISVSRGAVTSSWRYPSSRFSPSTSDSQARPDIGADSCTP